MPEVKSTRKTQYEDGNMGDRQILWQRDVERERERERIVKELNFKNVTFMLSRLFSPWDKDR